jgi:hypothetical protein
MLKSIILMILVAAMVLANCCKGISKEKPQKNQESLALQCLDQQFIGVLARTRARDTVPKVKLSLTDPAGRKQGKDVMSSETIPDSRYGTVIQLRNQPEHSKAFGIEVCNAETGVYGIEVAEQDSQAYVLDVTGIGNTENSQSLLLHHISRPGRVLHYRFRFKIEGRKVVLRWLDEEGNDVLEIEPNEW